MMVIFAKVRLEHKFSEGSFLIVETGGYFVLHRIYSIADYRLSAVWNKL